MQVQPTIVLFLPRILISSNFFSTSPDPAPASLLYEANTYQTQTKFYHLGTKFQGHLCKKLLSVWVGAQEGALEDIEIDALVLGNTLLETEPEVYHCKSCVLTIFL